VVQGHDGRNPKALRVIGDTLHMTPGGCGDDAGATLDKVRECKQGVSMRWPETVFTDPANVIDGDRHVSMVGDAAVVMGASRKSRTHERARSGSLRAGDGLPARSGE
jgi:hypothetical protein